jgi:hypothetical protein
MEERWNDIDRGKQKNVGKKTCISATLSTTNPTWTEQGANSGLRGERPATKSLSRGTALIYENNKFWEELIRPLSLLKSLFEVLEPNLTELTLISFNSI